MRLLGQPRVERGEVRLGRRHQLLEAVDDEIGLLEGVDAVAGAHDPLQVEANPVRRPRFQRVQRFALGRDDAGAVDAQALGGVDQAEFHRVPVQAGQVLQRLRADGVRLDPAAAVGGHVVGEHRVHQQRHMAEQVMEQIRFCDVVDLVGAADPPGHREAAVGQVLEEVQFRQQAFHADQGPAGGRAQHFVELVEARDHVLAHAHLVLGIEEFAAGAADQQFALAPVQRAPGGMVVGAVAVPRLLHHGSGIDRHVSLVGLLVLYAARGSVHGGIPGKSITGMVESRPRNRCAKLRRMHDMAQHCCVDSMLRSNK